MAGPEPADFFLPAVHPQLSQGDIVLAPTAVLWSDGARTPDFRTPAAPELGAHVTIPVWDSYRDGMPIPVAEVSWSPAMVLSHDCELDKEFNRAVAALVDSGSSKDEAVRQASANPELDPYVLLSPLLGLDQVEPALRASVQQGQLIGYFPIPAVPLFDDDPFVIDLRRITTVDRRLVTSYEKQASLAPESVGVLRYKLCEALAWRGLSIVSELEAMAGQTIDAVQVAQKSKKKTGLALHLSDGSIVNVEIRTPPTGIRAAVERIINTVARD